MTQVREKYFRAKYNDIIKNGLKTKKKKQAKTPQNRLKNKKEGARIWGKWIQISRELYTIVRGF